MFLLVDVLWMFLLVDVFIIVSLAHFLSNTIHQHESFVDDFISRCSYDWMFLLDVTNQSYNPHHSLLPSFFNEAKHKLSNFCCLIMLKHEYFLEGFQRNFSVTMTNQTFCLK